MKIWLKIVITAVVSGLLLGFTLFSFHFFEVQAVPNPQELSLSEMLAECRAVPYGVMFFFIMLAAEIAWYADFIFKKEK